MYDHFTTTLASFHCVGEHGTGSTRWKNVAIFLSPWRRIKVTIDDLELFRRKQVSSIIISFSLSTTEEIARRFEFIDTRISAWKTSVTSFSFGDSSKARLAAIEWFIDEEGDSVSRCFQSEVNGIRVEFVKTGNSLIKFSSPRTTICILREKIRGNSRSGNFEASDGIEGINRGVELSITLSDVYDINRKRFPLNGRIRKSLVVSEIRQRSIMLEE